MSRTRTKPRHQPRDEPAKMFLKGHALFAVNVEMQAVALRLVPPLSVRKSSLR